MNSYQYKCFGDDEPYCDICGVNFENTDLSRSNLNNCCGYIESTNLANTNIKFVPRDQKPFVCMIEVNLTNLDLSDFYVDGVNFFDGYGAEHHYFENCDLSNTKINITFNKNDKYYNSGARDNIVSMLNTGKLKGCYLNGTLIKEYNAKNEEEKESIKNQILNEYTLFEKGIHDSVIKSIQEQSKKFR